MKFFQVFVSAGAVCLRTVVAENPDTVTDKMTDHELRAFQHRR